VIHLEQIVRPFQSALAIGTRRVIVVPLDPPDDEASISWGVAGELPEAIATENPVTDGDPEAGGIGYQIKSCNDTLQEKARNTEDVRVENPDDPDQYVIIARVKSMTFNKKPKNKGFGGTTDWAPIDLFGGGTVLDHYLQQQLECDQQFSFKNG